MIDLSDLQKISDELIETYQAVEDTPIPSNIKEAVDTRWVLAVDALRLGAFMAYDPERQKEDRTRAITLSKAMQLLADYEQDLVKQFVLSPGSLIEAQVKSQVKSLFKTALRLFRVASTIWAHWSFITDIFRFRELIDQTIEALWPIIKDFWKEILVGAAGVELTKIVFSGVKKRDEFIKKVRKATLPQSTGPRHRKKIISRK